MRWGGGGTSQKQKKQEKKRPQNHRKKKRSNCVQCSTCKGGERRDKITSTHKGGAAEGNLREKKAHPPSSKRRSAHVLAEQRTPQKFADTPNGEKEPGGKALKTKNRQTHGG